METIGNPAIWAESGGLSGLVILALFLMLAVAIHSAKGVIETFRSEVNRLLENHSRERERMMGIIDARQTETNEVIRNLTIAINKMAERHRRFEIGDDR